jgi:hypothetical protein
LIIPITSVDEKNYVASYFAADYASGWMIKESGFNSEQQKEI